MTEGVKASDGAVLEQGSRKREVPPEPPADAEQAPRGWRFDKLKWQWVPKLAPGRKTSAEPAAAGEPGPGGQSRDPEPGWMRENRGDARPGKIRAEDVPQEIKDDIAGLAGLVATPLLALIQQADPICGGALAANFASVMDATLPLICRSERIIQYFAEDKADWLLWGKLAMALAPVGQAVLQHHVLRSVEAVRDAKTGVVHIRPRTAAAGHGDHLTPPMPQNVGYAA